MTALGATGGDVDRATVAPEAAAEDLDAYVLHPPSVAREVQSDLVLVDTGSPSPLGRFAARVRFVGDVDARIATVRDWFRDRGLDAFTWKLGRQTTPADLEARLRAQGAHEDEAEPEHTAMVLDHEPPDAGGVVVKVVESYEEFVASAEISLVGFGGSFTDAERAAFREQLPVRYATYRDHSVELRYLAFVDGKPVAVGNARQTSAGVVALTGGATLPEGRGPRRLPRAGACALGRCGRRGHTGSRHPGVRAFPPNPRKTRLPCGRPCRRTDRRDDALIPRSPLGRHIGDGQHRRMFIARARAPPPASGRSHRLPPP